MTVLRDGKLPLGQAFVEGAVVCEAFPHTACATTERQRVLSDTLICKGSCLSKTAGSPNLVGPLNSRSADMYLQNNKNKILGPTPQSRKSELKTETIHPTP